MRYGRHFGHHSAVMVAYGDFVLHMYSGAVISRVSAPNKACRSLCDVGGEILY